ncbi:hypothetical protein [Pseudomonas anguilliseptica]|uniref:hypothetical protein n=1 Tax=Pseudomonas anguilliseptica TaxID=53406 RepID=UPI001FC9BC69|nr:hypothetical protein [Pseudomonas anguilliseptica]
MTASATVFRRMSPPQHAEKFARVGNAGHGGNQNFAGGGIHIGLGEHSLAASFACGIPGALTAVPFRCWLPLVSVLNRFAITLQGAEHQNELVLQHGRIDDALGFFGAVVAVDALRHQVHQLEFGVEPVFDLPR